MLLDVTAASTATATQRVSDAEASVRDAWRLVAESNCMHDSAQLQRMWREVNEAEVRLYHARAELAAA